MAGNVDTRIVQLQFENRQFERNIAKSQKSLDELKASMNFDETSRGLDKFSKSLDSLSFSNLEQNIQKLTDKFTGLGTASELIVSQIRRKIEEAARSVSSFIDSMTTQQISVGQQKYDMLNKSVRTIMNATGRSEEEVLGVMQRLNSYTDQTSYDFADMAQNIGKFTSVGIPLEKAEKQMEGIANWAAQSGAGIAEASRAMYNLSQAMGAGKLMKIDWKSIENAGMATKEFKEQMIQAGIEAGTLKKKGDKIFTKKGNVEVTFKNFAETLAKGWATSEVLGVTLEKYYWDDLYYKSEEAFQKALEADKKITQQEWKEFEKQKYVNEQSKEAVLEAAVTQGKLTKETLKNSKVIYKTLDASGKEIQITMDNFTESLDLGWFDESVYEKAEDAIGGLAKTAFQSAQKCLTFNDVLQAWRDQISTGWMNAYRIMLGDLSESMEFFSAVCDKVGESIKPLIDFFVDPEKGLLTIWAASGGRKSLFSNILGDYGEGLEDGAYGLLDIILDTGELIKDAFWDLVKIFIPENMQAIWDDDFFKSTGGRQAFLGSTLAQFTQNIQKTFQGIRDFFNEGIEVGGETTTRLQLIRNTILVVAGAIRLAYDTVMGIAGFFSSVAAQLEPSFRAILGFLSKLGVTFYEAAAAEGHAQTIPQFFQSLAEKLSPLSTAINFVTEKLTNLLNLFLDSGGVKSAVGTLFGAIGGYISRFFDYISRVAGPMITFIGDMFDILKDLFEGGFSEDILAKAGVKLKDALDKMLGSIPKSIQNLVKFFKTLYKNVKSVIQNKFSPESIKKLSEEIGGSFTGIVEKIPEGLKTGWNNIYDKLKKFFSNLWTKITGFFSGEQVQDVKDAGKNLFDRIIDWFKEKIEAVKTYFATVMSNLGFKAGSVGKALSDFFQSINLSKILLYIIGGLGITGVIVLAAKIFGVIKTLAKALKTLTDILTGKKKIVPLKKLLGIEDEAKTDFGDKLIKIAAAVAILAAAVYAIGTMKLDNALQGVIVLMDIFIMLVGASFLMKEAYKDISWEEGVAMIAGMVGMGTAVGKVARSILPIANINPQGFLQIIGTLVVIFGGLILLAYMSKDADMSKQNMAGLIGITGGISILIFALKSIANMKPEQIGTMLGTLFGIFVELFAFIFALSKTNSSLADKQLGQLAAVAGAIAILIFSLKSIVNMKPEQIGTMLGTLFIILAELFAFVWAINKTEGLGEKSIGQLAALAGAIALLMFTMIPLALLDIGQLAKSVLAISIILWELVGVTAVISNLEHGLGGTALAQLIALAGAVVLIAIALIPISLLRWDQLARGVIGITVIIGLLIGMIAVAGKSGNANWKAIVSLIAVAGAVMLLVLALTPLAMMDWEPLFKMGAVLAVITLALMGLLSKVEKVSSKAVLSTSLLMAVMTIMVIAIGAVMHDLKDIDWKIVAAFTVGIGILVWGIGSAISKLQNVDLVKGLKAILILVAAVAALGLVFSLIGPMILSSLGKALTDLAANLSFFATLIGEFTSKMSAADGSGGIGKAENVIERLKNLMANIGSVNRYSGSIRLFQTAMYMLGTAVAMFYDFTKDVGSLEDNATFALIKGLADCADDLNTITKLPIRTLQDQIGGLGGAMSIYAQGVKDVDGAGGFDFDEGEIPDVSKAIALMTEITKSFNSENAHFEIPDNMPDEDTLTHFGVQLAALAGGMKQFEEAGRGIGDPKKSNAIKTLEFFRDLQTQLRYELNEGLDFGVVTEFKENFDASIGDVGVLTQFGMDISAIGKALKDFATSTSIIDQSSGEMKPIDFSNATGALQSFVEIKEKLPDVGGVLQWIIGKQEDLTGLGTEITTVAAALSELSARIKGGEYNGQTYQAFDSASTSIVVKALDEWVTGINQITEKLYEIPTVESGDNPYSIHDKHDAIMNLGKEIAVIGPALNTLSASICGGKGYVDGKEVTYEAFKSESTGIAKTAIEDMAVFLETIRDDLPRVGGLVNIADTFWNGRQGNMEDLSKELGWLGKGLNSLSTNIGDNFDVQKATDAIKVLDAISNLMLNTQKLSGSGIFSGTYLVGELAQFLEGLSETTVWSDTYAGQKLHPIETLVKEMAQISMLVNSTEGIDKGAIEMFYQMASAIGSLTHSDPNFNFEDIGTHIAEGIAEGIKKGEVLVTTAASKLVLVARDAAEKAGIIKSPSRLFAGVGEYLSSGMAEGITQKTNLVEDASRDMVLSSMQAITRVSGNVDDVANEYTGHLITSVSQALSEDLDPNPTITPVLNLDQARAELTLFQNQLGMSYMDLNLASNMAGRVADQNGRTPTEGKTIKVDFNGIYERMNQMSENITKLGRDMRSMRLVLNTGALVGGLSDGIDEDFGRKQFYANRNN